MVGVKEFRSSTSCARLTVVLDVCSDTRPCIIPSDKNQCFVLTIMTRDRVVMIIEQDSKSEIIGIWYPNMVVIT